MARRSSAVVAGVVAVVLVGGAVAAIELRPRPEPAQASADPALTTTTVRRVDLADTRMVAGTLGFGSANPVKGAGPGVLTKLPKTGATISRGTVLYRVNDQPVVVLYGDTPLFRPIDKPGLTGRDVRQLRHNLTVLGYRSSARHDDVCDASLLDALRHWQRDLGLPQPGALRPGQAVIVAGPGRVSAVTAQLGDPADGPLLSITSTAKVVTVPMSPADASSLRTGMAVTITGADGKAAPGRIISVSQAAADAGDGNQPPKMTVTIAPDDAVDSSNSTSVQVRFTTISRNGVLAVPVGALVALQEGGYAMQRPDGTLIAVTTGLFANGMVQVSGPDVADGTAVVTTP
ncbi:HlyD family secretion protein [Actinoplanes sp. KI2]|uniref:HlyD family secretion protein n=1 Tax=Actinoplanes sp. KI2 TaxID=2983315 RepID=UPI0021D5850F|nr:HlyD family secretion protein [Actinoplanes sp. KI2]MCU7729366.1 HlyD family secretion protein [Actinoplanes sp. KI2]